jgi:hypothetical protein
MKNIIAEKTMAVKLGESRPGYLSPPIFLKMKVYERATNNWLSGWCDKKAGKHINVPIFKTKNQLER